MAPVPSLTHESWAAKGLGLVPPACTEIATTASLSKLSPNSLCRKPAHYYELQIDTKLTIQFSTNRGDGLDICGKDRVIAEKEYWCDFLSGTGSGRG